MGSGLTVAERMAIVESDLRALQVQRDREHTENQTVLGRIEDQGRRTGSTVDGIKETVDAQAEQLAEHSERLDDIEGWRKGLTSEIRGALKIPKVLLAATPIVMVVLAIWAAVKP